MIANRKARKVLVGCAAAAAVIFSGLAWATTGSGTVSTLVGPAATFEPFRFKMGGGFTSIVKSAFIQTAETSATAEVITRTRESNDGWNIEIAGPRGLSVSTQSITFQPGSQSGWHTHPGPVFISVKEGTMTFYDHNCVATVRMAGQGFLDTGEDPHIARNETGLPATNIVTYFAPPGTPALRIDAPQPSKCGV